MSRQPQSVRSRYLEECRQQGWDTREDRLSGWVGIGYLLRRAIANDAFGLLQSFPSYGEAG